MKVLISYILILGTLNACKNDDASTTPDVSGSHIKHFGFTLVDTHWDDPTDSETKSNYADEIHTFSNLADILVANPSDDLVQRAHNFKDLELKAILHLNELFFELVDANSPSGTNYNLRADYEERWNTFNFINHSILNANYIGALYIGEEPTWNGITFSELNNVAQLIKAEKPTIPLLVIEAFPSLNDLQVPELIDWIGFDRYFVRDPNINTDYQKDWKTLQSKITNPSQKIMVIMDSHYIDWAHGGFGNIDVREMGEVANNYYKLAKSDKRVIGILGYFWPNGFDTPESIGARGMPSNVKSEYERIGKEMTGKNN